jgi:hypothetical protein
VGGGREYVNITSRRLSCRETSREVRRRMSTRRCSRDRWRISRGSVLEEWCTSLLPPGSSRPFSSRR